MLKIGINYPWFKYGWDFGKAALGWVKSGWKSTVKKDICELRKLGIFAMRWFILGDGRNYGKGVHAPHEDRYKKGQWRFDEPPALTKQFLRDFEWVLKTLSTYKMQLLPSLIDFRWCFPGSSLSNPRGKSFSFIKGGRIDILIDERKYKIFFEKVLKPLLGVSIKYKEAIFAWELINEPEWIVKKTTVTYDWIKNFLKTGIGIINKAGFRSTIGFAHYDSLKEWDSIGLGVSLHQFHYYPGSLKISTLDKLRLHKYSERYPCFIGEFSSSEEEFPDYYIYRWPELGDEQSIYAKIKLIEAKGYPYAFLWSMRAKDRATNWSGDTKLLLAKIKEEKGIVS
jgi:hypothetical protein